MSGALEVLSTGGPIMLLVLRVVIGLNFLVGRGIRHVMKERRLAAEKWKERGVPPAATEAAGLLNFFGAILLMIGLAVPLLASLFAAEMVLTTLLQKYTLKAPYFAIKGHGYELNITYLLLFGVLIVLGGGAFSLDSLIGF